MANGKGEGQSAATKRGIRDVPSTPGKGGSSPMRLQPKKVNEEHDDPVKYLKSEIFDALNVVLDTRLNQLAERIESMVFTKIQELEEKFQNIDTEVKKLKEDVDDSINHVEVVLKQDVDCVWEYAVKNEQYSRKNNLQIHGLDEEEGENLEERFVQFVQENLHEEIQPTEIEIGQKKNANRDQEQGSSNDRKRVRLVILKFLSHKSKMNILLKRRLLNHGRYGG